MKKNISDIGGEGNEVILKESHLGDAFVASRDYFKSFSK